MPQTDEATWLKLALPPHVAEILTGWAVFELRKTPEEVLEALAEELTTNEQLREFTAKLAGISYERSLRDRPVLCTRAVCPEKIQFSSQKAMYNPI
jgi:hypothetical protein